MDLFGKNEDIYDYDSKKESWVYFLLKNFIKGLIIGFLIKYFFISENSKERRKALFNIFGMYMLFILAPFSLFVLDGILMDNLAFRFLTEILNYKFYCTVYIILISLFTVYKLYKKRDKLWIGNKNMVFLLYLLFFLFTSIIYTLLEA